MRSHAFMVQGFMYKCIKLNARSVNWSNVVLVRVVYYEVVFLNK